MAVSDKMSLAIFNNGGDILNVQAQEVVNAAWNIFDPKDESTWPYDDVFKDWYLDVNGVACVSQFGTHKEGLKPHWRGVSINYNIRIGKRVLYADPKDLKFEEKNDE